MTMKNRSLWRGVRCELEDVWSAECFDVCGAWVAWGSVAGDGWGEPGQCSYLWGTDDHCRRCSRAARSICRSRVRRPGRSRLMPRREGRLPHRAAPSERLVAIAGEVEVTGPAGGPYTIYFSGKYGEVSQPALGADSSDLTGPGSPMVKIVTDVVGGEGYDTHYHFEYVAQKQFDAGGGEGGFAKASSTPGVDLGTGDNVKYVGADLPVLTAGETYRFRAVAGNTSPHEPVIYGEEQSLMVPATQVAASEGSCPNEVLRTGPSALLPDCRAFEQLTPVDKEGAKEIFNYGGSFGNEGALPGGDGDSFVYASPVVKWGGGPSAGQSPYFFSRTSGGWRVTAGTAQPEAGIFGSRPQVFGPGLAEVGFAAFWITSPSSASSHTEFEAGPAGGPYVTVASVPSAQAEPGWVASSGDFSKLVLQVADHTLLGHSTHTGEGDDLYEYSNGALRQANVTGPGSGVTIGSCGATIADAPAGNRPLLTTGPMVLMPCLLMGRVSFSKRSRRGRAVRKRSTCTCV